MSSIKGKELELSDLRIGNWLQRLDGTEFQITVQDFAILEGLPKHLWPKPIKLDVQWLDEFQFVNDVKVHKKTDTDGLWIIHGITIYQNFWEQDVFNYATYVKGDGSFKGGFSVPYVHQLQNMVSSMSGGYCELKRVVKSKLFNWKKVMSGKTLS